MAYFLRILIIIINITNMVQVPVYASNAGKDYVVLIHGMAQSKRSMSKIAAYLESKNYTPVVIDYPSTKHSIEEIYKIL